MNNPLSDGNESVIDIFVLGESEAGTLELMKQLEHQDYRVTPFTNGPQLIDTLRSGKPNLIICDTTSFGQEAYDYCRQIKSDDTLWMIPVMILTRASSLSDLLFVLDSNADNFIAKPYDTPYLLSLIEGMLSTPVERQTVDQIKTQFKIQHDDQIFVVTADRRKLLEFLLSAFEIAVKNSEDLSSAHAELQELSVQLRTHEDAGIENARVIGMLSASVRKKEQEERILKGDLDETEKALGQKTEKIGQLSRDLGDTRALLTTAEEHIRMLLEEGEKTALSHQSEMSLLAEQVSSLSQEISAKTTELDASRQALDGETTRSAILDLALKELTVQTGHLKTSLEALTLEQEQRESALLSEKNRAQAAEDAVQSLLQAKTQSEQEMSRLVDEQKDITRQQNSEIHRLKTELEAETHRCTSAEARLETLLHDMEQSEATHTMEEESQRRQIVDLQARCDTAAATIFAQERDVKILRDELVVAQANGEKTAASAASVAAAFNETRVEIEEREWKVQSLEKQIADGGIRQEKSDEKVRLLTASLESVQSALEAEKAEHAAVEERLNAAIRERDETLQSVHGAHDQIKTDLDQHKNDLARLNRDLEAAALLRSTLQGDITAASSRIKELEHELNSAVQEKERTGKQARSLSEEREKIHAELETERRTRRSAEADLQKSAQANSRLEGEIARSAAEREGLHAALEQERMLRTAAVEKARDAAHAQEHGEHEVKPVKDDRQEDDDLRGAKIQKLNQDFEQMLARQRDLEQKVKTLESQKATAEARADALSDEIQQARTALADEWEDHVNDEERLAASEKKAARMAESLSRSGTVVSERERKWAVVVKQTGLPAEIRPVPQAVVVTPPPAPHDAPAHSETSDQNPEVSPSPGIEDLFEEDPAGPGARGKISEIPGDPVGGSKGETHARITDEEPVQEPDPGDEHGPDEQDDEAEDAEEDGGGTVKTLNDSATTPLPDGISFNRQQWLDLLKWSHHSGNLTQEQRMQIVRMGRLIQKGRKLTKKQDEQVREMIVLVRTLGYQFH